MSSPSDAKDESNQNWDVEMRPVTPESVVNSDEKIDS